MRRLPVYLVLDVSGSERLSAAAAETPAVGAPVGGSDPGLPAAVVGSAAACVGHGVAPHPSSVWPRRAAYLPSRTAPSGVPCCVACVARCASLPVCVCVCGSVVMGDV